jgi:hypothetical protein
VRSRRRPIFDRKIEIVLRPIIGNERGEIRQHSPSDPPKVLLFGNPFRLLLIEHFHCPSLDRVCGVPHGLAHYRKLTIKLVDAGA